MLAAVLALAALAPQDPSDPRAPVAAFVADHCARCHDPDTKKGGVDLESAIERDLRGVRDDARLWRKATELVHARQMPTQRARSQPDDATRDGFVTAVRALLRAAADATPPDPGAPTLRRLNRVQYRNAVRDLLGVDVDVAAALPDDPRGYGFDAVGDVLFTSPLLLEKYWDATQRALDALFADPAAVERRIGALPATAGALDAALTPVFAAVLREAFRRPVDPTDVARRVAIVTEGVAAGEPVAAGVRRALASVLLAPRFLFRVEARRPDVADDAVVALDDHELAVRLAFFLTASAPDAELRAVADAGRLVDPAELGRQVDRLCAEPRARSLADEFGAQWLGYAELRTLARDIRRFGAFGGLRGAMYEEAARTIDSLFRENRSVLELLDADTTFVDEALAQHYGIADVRGGELRRVVLPDRNRGGVLGWAATLTVTSTPLRTNPVRRGRFVLEHLLGEPPPPPPPNAGTLPEDDQQTDGVSLRERLERHRRQPSCAGCHARIDPYGLALEGFDGIGRLRTEAYGKPVDATATLPDGTALDGVATLKDHLLARRDAFVRTMVENLFVYALGRPPEGADEATIDAIVDGVVADGYRARTMVALLVQSFPFRHRRNA